VTKHLYPKSLNIAAGTDATTNQITCVASQDAIAATVFWPIDLLPKDCPNSRILMFGYDSKVTKYSAGAISENSIFSHSKDLLFALSRERTLHRPLVCIAHSLGGIIVKEVSLAHDI
jgi:hypothetical protein